MEIKLDIPFRQLLTVVKRLTPSQKAKLRQELTEEETAKEDKTEFIEMLMNGPVYSEKDIQTIEDNRKSIAKWRIKN